MYRLHTRVSELPSTTTAVVRSHQNCLYTLLFQYDNQEELYSLDGNTAHCFRNLVDIKEVLGGIQHQEAWLIQESAYDEMVGQLGGGNNTLKVPFSTELPY